MPHTDTAQTIVKGQVWEHAEGTRRRVKEATDTIVHLVPEDLPETAWFLSPFATQWERTYFLERWTLVADA